MFAAIASFLNSILELIEGLKRVVGVASNPIGAFIGQTTTNEAVSTETIQTPQATTENPQTKAATGKRAFVTIPERITARFNDTGSPAWRNQPGGKHLGTDFGGTNGTPVFAPWGMNIIYIGSYADEGRKGDYVIGKTDNGTEYYSGHLTGIRVKVGDYVRSGTQIGQIGYYNHTHVQLRVNGQLTDFEVYEKQ